LVNSEKENLTDYPHRRGGEKPHLTFEASRRPLTDRVKGRRSPPSLHKKKGKANHLTPHSTREIFMRSKMGWGGRGGEKERKIGKANLTFHFARERGRKEALVWTVKKVRKLKSSQRGIGKKGEEENGFQRVRKKGDWSPVRSQAGAS